MVALAKRLWAEEEGQGMAEYGLILALVAIAVIAVLSTMGDELSNIFSNVSTELKDATAN